MLNHTIDDTLWGTYSSVFFHFESQIRAEKFAVITAWNPKSQRLPESQNCVNNKRLLKMISQYEWVNIQVGDAGFHWVEDSFAVAASLDESLNIARYFGQNAIYYVKQGQLFLHSCIDDRVSCLGALSEKIYNL